MKGVVDGMDLSGQGYRCHGCDHRGSFLDNKVEQNDMYTCQRQTAAGMKQVANKRDLLDGHMSLASRLCSILLALSGERTEQE